MKIFLYVTVLGILLRAKQNIHNSIIKVKRADLSDDVRGNI